MTRDGITVAITGQALIHGPLDLSVAGADKVSAALSNTDASFANLEVSVNVPGAWPTKTKTLHLTSLAGLDSLRQIGLTALGHANNHAFDLGPPGIIATHEAAGAAGLALAGSGVDADQAGAAVCPGSKASTAFIAADLGPQGEIVYAGKGRPGINPLRVRRSVEVPADDFANLQRLTVALGDQQREMARAKVGYRSELAQDGFELFGVPVRQGTAIADLRQVEPDDLARLKSTIAGARERAEIVVVALHSHHWDADWRRPTAWLLDIARDLIDAGADLIVGTGAPMLQQIAFHCGKPICAGLGNFIFHTWRADTYEQASLDVWTGAVLRCQFGADRQCREIGLLPVRVGRPEPVRNGLPPGPNALTGNAARLVHEHMVNGLDPAERRLVVPLWA